ncbi:hypothetical protein Unana1_02042 [Umbelopsis nana]
MSEREGQAYCKTCYNRKWGPKGYGSGVRSFMHTENKTAREVLAESDWAAETAASSPSTSIQHTASMNTGSQTFPSDKLSGVAPSLPARPSNTVPSLPARLATPNKTPSTPPVIPPKPAIATSSHSPSAYVNSRTGYIPKKLNLQMNSDLCAKCDKPVYAAELVHGASKKYHKMCFRCFNCNKQLDSTNMVDKNFEGYGYGGLLSTEGATR